MVLSVYDQLKAEGYIIAHHGSGTMVALAPGIQSENVAEPSVVEPVRTPVNPGLPDPNLFPRQDWSRAYRSAVKQLPDADLGYGDPQGYEPLRNELANYLGRVRGLRTKASNILVVNGFAQGLAILGRVMPASGIGAVAVEDPGSTGTRGQLNDWGIATPPVTVDHKGLRVDGLEVTGASAVLVTPAHHYPTGVVLAPERRQQLIAWVNSSSGRYIIEDDYDAEYRYDSAPVGSLQPLAPERVVTGSSVSKTLAPALRLGWLVLPSDLVDAAASTKAMFDLGTSVFAQAALVELLRSGALDRHLRRSRTRYRRRRAQIAEYLATHLPDHPASGLEAGLNVCIQLEDVDDRALVAGLRGTGVSCQSLSHYQQNRPSKPGIVFDITATTPTDLDAIVSAILTTPPAGGGCARCGEYHP